MFHRLHIDTVLWIHCRILFIRRIVQEWYTRKGNAEGTPRRCVPLIINDCRREGTEGLDETTTR